MTLGDFKDYEGTGKDVQGNDSKSVVSAAVVTDGPTEVVTPTGNRTLYPGDVVIRTARPDVFETLTGDQWKGTGYGTGGKSAAPTGGSAGSGSGSGDPKGGSNTP